MNKMKSTLYILDISNMIHRAFHVHQNLSTSQGFPTGAVYGTVSMLAGLIDKYQPMYFLVCYDAQTDKSLRKDAYPLYKSNRVQVTGVSEQEKVIRAFLEELNIPSVEAPGYEADDLIYTYTQAVRGSMNVVVISGDKDLLQLVSDKDGVSVLDTMKNIQYNEQLVHNKFGVPASRVLDYLALVGDTSDCIPGVKGIGPKAAQDILNNDVSVLSMLRTPTSIPAKYTSKILPQLETLAISYDLASLKLVPDVKSINELEFKPQWTSKNDTLFSKLEFNDNIKNKVLNAIKAYK